MNSIKKSINFSIRALFCLSLLGIFLFQFPLEANNKDMIRTERYSKRVVIVTGGGEYGDQVAAIATKKGIVVIDTGLSPTLTQRYKKIIEKELGRNDYAYVINTHYHYDHTNGNQVFAGTDIIAHEKVPALMKSFDGRRLAFADQRETLTKSRIEKLKKLGPDSKDSGFLRDIIYTVQYMVKDLRTNYKLTLPTITFNDRMTLDMGDVTLNLYYFGEGLHTGDDIIIHCPEEKIVFSGDIFWKESLVVAYVRGFNIVRWMKVLDTLLKDMDKVEWFYDCHNGRMPGKHIKLWRRYLGHMWKGIKKAQKAGLSLEDVKKKFAYEKEFKYLEESGLKPDRLKGDHKTSITLVWNQLLNLKSAATELEKIINGPGLEKALKAYKQMVSAKNKKYYFDGNEFNNLGYKLLGLKKLKAAIEIFKMYVAQNPKSFNAYDSLGEAYMIAGDKKKAIINYTKSVELNPQHEGGKKMLKKLKE